MNNIIPSNPLNNNNDNNNNNNNNNNSEVLSGAVIHRPYALNETLTITWSQQTDMQQSIINYYKRIHFLKTEQSSR